MRIALFTETYLPHMKYWSLLRITRPAIIT